LKVKKTGYSKQVIEYLFNAISLVILFYAYFTFLFFTKEKM